jgi:DNA invertase Pin-like site-specific DNA recombinase
VFALEVSRLARSNLDWHRLLELCALTTTLVIDEDGCYDPADFNDGLLLGLKGTMAQAELHFLHARLQGGKLNKAKKGELRFPLPVGFCYDQENRIILDPDEEVRGAVGLVFRLFRETGTAFAVMQRFADGALRFPKRSYFYCVINDTRRRQHKGQHGSCCTRNRAILIRSVAIEWGLCRWARTLRPPRPEVGRYLGGA